MMIKYLLDLSADASDLLDFFEDVTTPEQLVSRLERLKRGAAEEMFACIEGLRASVENFLQDTVEPSGALDAEPDDEATESGDDLNDLISELEKPDDAPVVTSATQPPPVENENLPPLAESSEKQ